MKEKIAKINRTLFELGIGILIYGTVCQLFVFFVKDRQGYSLGLWLGVFIALVSAFHMWWSLDRSLGLEEKSAVKKMSTHNVLRYLFIVAAFVLICLGQRANPLAAFLGIMGLKAAAYMQPFTKKISTFIYGKEILPELIEEPADEQDM